MHADVADAAHALAVSGDDELDVPLGPVLEDPVEEVREAGMRHTGMRHTEALGGRRAMRGRHQARRPEQLSPPQATRPLSPETNCSVSPEHTSSVLERDEERPGHCLEHEVVLATNLMYRRYRGDMRASCVRWVAGGGEGQEVVRGWCTSGWVMSCDTI